MAIGKRKKVQESLWVSTSDLPKSPGHPFYSRLNRILAASGFDQFAEAYCERFYAPVLGRPSLSPGRYFRLLLIGYFEGLDSERGMSWRASDSLAIRGFLELGLSENAPDHSTISRTRRLIDVETHREVFSWILERIAEAGLLKGTTIGIDGTTLEANAAMRSIVRRDTGETYQEFLSRLAKASGIKTPTRQALTRLDRRRKKKGANTEWASPADPDARITKMKDGRTHLSHKTEHAVDMATGAIVAVSIEGADRGDTQTIRKTLSEARDQIETVQSGTASGDGSGLQEVVLDKGYHSTAVLLALESAGIRSYVSEPDRGRRKWRGDLAARSAVYSNRRRNRGERGKCLQRLRGERVERPFAHLYRTGRMRRTHLRGHENILKRLLVHSGALNLGLLMRQALGVGTPRGLQSRFRAVLSLLFTLWRHLTTNDAGQARHIERRYRLQPLQLGAPHGYAKPAFATGS